MPSYFQKMFKVVEQQQSLENSLIRVLLVVLLQRIVIFYLKGKAALFCLYVYTYGIVESVLNHKQGDLG